MVGKKLCRYSNSPRKQEYGQIAKHYGKFCGAILWGHVLVASAGGLYYAKVFNLPRAVYFQRGKSDLLCKYSCMFVLMYYWICICMIIYFLSLIDFATIILVQFCFRSYWTWKSWTFVNQMNHGSKITKRQFRACSHRRIFPKICRDVYFIIIYRIPSKQFGGYELIFDLWLQTQWNTLKNGSIIKKVDFEHVPPIEFS